MLTFYQLNALYQIAKQHQIDIDKMYQYHCNKQEHNMSTSDKSKNQSMYHNNVTPSITSTSKHQQKEEEQPSQQHPS